MSSFLSRAFLFCQSSIQSNHQGTHKHWLCQPIQPTHLSTGVVPPGNPYCNSSHRQRTPDRTDSNTRRSGSSINHLPFSTTRKTQTSFLPSQYSHLAYYLIFVFLHLTCSIVTLLRHCPSFESRSFYLQHFTSAVLLCFSCIGSSKHCEHSVVASTYCPKSWSVTLLACLHVLIRLKRNLVIFTLKWGQFVLVRLYLYHMLRTYQTLKKSPPIQK